jgi:hypothetical protein
MFASSRTDCLFRRFAIPCLAVATVLGAGSGLAAGTSSLDLSSPPSGGRLELAPAAGVETTRVGYQKFINETCMGTGSQCEIEIERIARNRRLEVTSVSCVLQSAGAPQFVALTDQQASDFFAPQVSIPGYASFNTVTAFSVPERRRLSLVFASDQDELGLTCKVAGEMVFLE